MGIMERIATGDTPHQRVKNWFAALNQAGWVGYTTPGGLRVWYNQYTGVIHTSVDSISSVGRIARRIVRYTALAAALGGIGFGAGYYLTMAQAAGVAAVTSIVGGAVATRMIAGDVAAIGARLGVQSRLTRFTISAYGGTLFGLLPFVGAGAGLLYWFAGSPGAMKYRDYFRRRIIRAGRRGLTGWGNY